VKPAPPGGSEFLSGMMNANSPHGLVPKFPSWSLLSLGKYSSYSSTSGKISPSWEQVLVWEKVDKHFLLEKEMLIITWFNCNIITYLLAESTKKPIEQYLPANFMRLLNQRSGRGSETN